MNKYKRTIIRLSIGLIGSILMGIGDYLMIYGNPQTIGQLSWITVGTGQISAFRNLISVLIGFPAVLCYVPSLLTISNFFTSSRERTMYKRLTIFSFIPWLCIHIFVAMVLYNYHWLYTNGYTEIAYSSAEALANQYMIIFYLGDIIMILPFIYILFMIIFRKTILPVYFLINNPIIIYLLLKAFYIAIPQCSFKIAFLNGLMNESMFIWQGIYIIYFMFHIETKNTQLN